MNMEDVKRMLHARPFQPFLIYLVEGGRLLVKHEDYVAVAPSGRTMIVYSHDRADDYEVLELMMVTRLEATGDAAQAA
jgi:hypothetical protein